MSFFERLEARVKAVDSLLCVGLDPHAAQVRRKNSDGWWCMMNDDGWWCPDEWPLLQLPEATGKAAFDFCKRLIDATLTVIANASIITLLPHTTLSHITYIYTHQTAASYKPNIAFFEALGIEGWQALADLIKLIPEEIPILLDAKRGDISTTAEAYAQAAIQVSPSLPTPYPSRLQHPYINKLNHRLPNTTGPRSHRHHITWLYGIWFYWAFP